MRNGILSVDLSVRLSDLVQKQLYMVIVHHSSFQTRTGMSVTEFQL